MKRFLLFIFTLFILASCSNKNVEQLSKEDLEGLNSEEKVEAIVDNTNLLDEEYHIVIEESSLAVVYSSSHVPDSTLVLDSDSRSFPNVAMTLIEHLISLDFDEIVITSYDPVENIDMTGISKVSALFTKNTVEEIDFEEWNEKKERTPQMFYRLSDAYLIRGMIWEDLDDETIDKLRNNNKSHESGFWDYYGSYVE